MERYGSSDPTYLAFGKVKFHLGLLHKVASQKDVIKTVVSGRQKL
jgi:hypothetical protein